MAVFFKPHNLFVFDIETIPDEEVAFNLIGNEFADLNAKREALTDYHLKITDGKNPFLRQPFHKVVAISFLIATIDYDHNGQEIYSFQELRSGGEEHFSEEMLIKGFFKKIAELKPRLVSFNGKNFDMPVLKYRAMKYGISAMDFHSSGDKYENYNHRYSLGWHCDLIDALSDFGGSAKVKLNEVCAIMGFPGKIGIDGSKVTGMYDSGNLKEIRDYCETDVLNTYLTYLRYYLHIGKISKNSYNQAIEEILNFILSKKLPHLSDFYQQWEIACKGSFKL